ncbi:Uncharacterised protein [Mycobacteroides abscessus subsp. abscessus]|nr:Uncharacterised protein [Mycobacteroides abscessus subsp. abscessus]
MATRTVVANIPKLIAFLVTEASSMRGDKYSSNMALNRTINASFRVISSISR